MSGKTAYRTPENNLSQELTFDDIFVALGGEPRNWHPAHSGLPRPETTEDRPDLSHFSEAIGTIGEEYLEDTYDMEYVDRGPVDLVVTDGVFEGTPVQAKTVIRLASRGDGVSDGGIYMKGPAMAELTGAVYDEEGRDYVFESEPEEALLHTIVHQPKEQYTEEERDSLDVPVRTIETDDGQKVADTALVGEAVIAAHRAVENNKFNGGERRAKYWHWSRAYQPFKDSANNVVKPCEWYGDTFVSRNL